MEQLNNKIVKLCMRSVRSPGVKVLKWLHEFANKREAEIWKEFRTEMFLNHYKNWLVNGSCEACYNKAADKKQAVRDIPAIRNAKKFREASGYDPK
jgi:hypothetical protein